MSLELNRKLIGSISNLAAALLVAVLSVSEAWAQVVFAVSSENKVVSKFSDSTLIKTLRSGEIKPEDVFKIYVGIKERAEIGNRSAIIGAYKIIPGQIAFEPLVPFSETLPYLAVFGDSAVFQFQFAPPPNRPRTKLLEIYPTIDRVPANLLKVYLRFSRPMREGEVYDRVQLYSQNGDLISNPFVPLQPELWDSSGHMVTLWLDPGRVKRALQSAEAHGPILEEGGSYLLVVDSLWKDVHGQRLEQGFTKPFTVTAADRIKPETKVWQLTAPAALTQDPLMVAFGAPMDFGSTQHAFSVWPPKGEALTGLTAIADYENIWKLVPEKPWLSGTYRLRIYARLEDLAGNNLNRVFDRDLKTEPMTPSEQEFYWIEFEVTNRK